MKKSNNINVFIRRRKRGEGPAGGEGDQAAAGVASEQMTWVNRRGGHIARRIYVLLFVICTMYITYTYMAWPGTKTLMNTWSTRSDQLTTP